MKNTKYVVLGAAVIGLLAIFFPYASLGDESMSAWAFRKLEVGDTVGLLNGPKQVYLMLIGFLGAAVIAGLAVARKALGRGAAVGATLLFLVTLACEMVRKGFGGSEMPTAIGGKLLVIAALVGLVASIVGIAKPDRAA